MKITWGTGIALAFGLFVIGVFVLAGIAVTRPTDLVMDHSYEEGLRYQQHIDRVERSRRLEEPVSIRGDAAGITIAFPSKFPPQGIRGTILLYRPSDRSRDFALSLDPDSANRMTVPSSRLATGLWRVQVSWSAGGADYYNEQAFHVP